MTSPYDQLRLECLFAELPASGEQDARAKVKDALASLAALVGGISYRVETLLPDPRRQGWFGVEIMPPAAARIEVEQAWIHAHALSTTLGDARVEPTFQGELAPSQIAEPRGAEESTKTESEAAPQDVRWHLEASRVGNAHAWLRARSIGLGSGIRIGHPDTGYTLHPELGAADGSGLDLVRGLNLLEPGTPPLDPREQGPLLQPGHGTATGSVIIAADHTTVPREPSSTQPADLLGIAPQATLVPIRVTNSVIILGWQRRLAQAIEHAVDQGCAVISLSLGGLGGARLERAIEYAERRGVIVIAAAGNQVGFVVAPATHPLVVACAATGPDGSPWPGSSRGRAVDISAPGASVWVAGWRDHAAIARPGAGTSFATASVAAAAALWLCAHAAALQPIPTRRAALFRRALQQSARPAGLPAGQFGAGMLDCQALLEQPLPTSDATESTPDTRAGALARASLRTLLGDDAREHAQSTPLSTLDGRVLSELVFHLTLDPELRRRYAGYPAPLQRDAVARQPVAHSESLAAVATPLPSPSRASPLLRSALRKLGSSAPGPLPPAATAAAASHVLPAAPTPNLLQPSPSGQATISVQVPELGAELRIVLDLTIRVEVARDHD